MGRFAEVPSDDEVVETLEGFKCKVSARKLYEALVDKKHGRAASQIAIQRAIERGRVLLNEDLTLSVGDCALPAAA